MMANSGHCFSAETGFKAQIAATLGGGGAISAQDVIVDSITSGSINVEWHVEVPATVMTEVANLVATMAVGPPIVVSVGGEAFSATEVAAPVVYVEPDVDCVGAWTECDNDAQSFDITTVVSGNGRDCSFSYNEQRACGAPKVSVATIAAPPPLVLGPLLLLLSATLAL
jgi:hypothetical protein